MRPSPFNNTNSNTQNTEMACNVIKRKKIKIARIALLRKLHIMRTLTNSKSVKKSGIIMDASVYIYKLRLQVEAIIKEYQHLIQHIQEVKVENLGRDYLLVKIRCKKSEDLLVSILEAFEEMNLKVVEARVTCEVLFGMEAILKADISADVLNQAILKLVRQQT